MSFLRFAGLNSSLCFNNFFDHLRFLRIDFNAIVSQYLFPSDFVYLQISIHPLYFQLSLFLFLRFGTLFFWAVFFFSWNFFLCEICFFISENVRLYFSDMCLLVFIYLVQEKKEDEFNTGPLSVLTMSVKNNTQVRIIAVTVHRKTIGTYFHAPLGEPIWTQWWR